ncbi:unnamed protein product [Cylindrotheca closterium]|uniref:Uncharacterized protein n=1 Tax=Cylindrotheca closterium TaxID=2856 RepID=A0AAD2JGN0_9STRA|nr:unnamed protein product [Cylindrotheca closterium]
MVKSENDDDPGLSSIDQAATTSSSGRLLSSVPEDSEHQDEVPSLRQKHKHRHSEDSTSSKGKKKHKKHKHKKKSKDSSTKPPMARPGMVRAMSWVRQPSKRQLMELEEMVEEDEGKEEEASHDKNGESAKAEKHDKSSKSSHKSHKKDKKKKKKKSDKASAPRPRAQMVRAMSWVRQPSQMQLMAKDIEKAVFEATAEESEESNTPDAVFETNANTEEESREAEDPSPGASSMEVPKVKDKARRPRAQMIRAMSWVRQPSQAQLLVKKKKKKHTHHRSSKHRQKKASKTKSEMEAMSEEDEEESLELTAVMGGDNDATEEPSRQSLSDGPDSTALEESTSSIGKQKASKRGQGPKRTKSSKSSKKHGGSQNLGSFLNDAENKQNPNDSYHNDDVSLTVSEAVKQPSRPSRSNGASKSKNTLNDAIMESYDSFFDFSADIDDNLERQFGAYDPGGRTIYDVAHETSQEIRHDEIGDTRGRPRQSEVKQERKASKSRSKSRPKNRSKSPRQRSKSRNRSKSRTRSKSPKRNNKALPTPEAGLDDDNSSLDLGESKQPAEAPLHDKGGKKKSRWSLSRGDSDSSLSKKKKKKKRGSNGHNSTSIIDMGGSLSSLRTSITNKFGFKKKRESSSSIGIVESPSTQGKEMVSIEELPTDDPCPLPPPIIDLEDSPAASVKSTVSNRLQNIDKGEDENEWRKADRDMTLPQKEERGSSLKRYVGKSVAEMPPKSPSETKASPQRESEDSPNRRQLTRTSSNNKGKKSEENSDFPGKAQLKRMSAAASDSASTSGGNNELPQRRQLRKTSSYSRPKSPSTAKSELRLSSIRRPPLDDGDDDSIEPEFVEKRKSLLAFGDGAVCDDDSIEPEFVEKRKSLRVTGQKALASSAKSIGDGGSVSSPNHDPSSSSSDDDASISSHEDDSHPATIPESMRTPVLSPIDDSEVNFKSKATRRLRASLGGLPAPPNEDREKTTIPRSESFGSPKLVPKQKEEQLKRSNSFNGEESPRIGIRKGGRKSGTFGRSNALSDGTAPNLTKPSLRRSLTSPEGSHRQRRSVEFSTTLPSKSPGRRRSPATSKSPRTSKSPLGREVKVGQKLNGATVNNVSLDFLVSPRAVQVQRRISLSNGAVMNDTYTKERSPQKDDLEVSAAAIQSNSQEQSDDEQIAKLKSFLYEEHDSESENSAELESAGPNVDEIRAEAKAIMEKRRQEKGIKSPPHASQGTASILGRLSEPVHKGEMANLEVDGHSTPPKRRIEPPKKVRSLDSVDSNVGLDEGEESLKTPAPNKKREPVRGIAKSLSSGAPSRLQPKRHSQRDKVLSALGAYDSDEEDYTLPTKSEREPTRGIGKSKSYSAPQRPAKRSQSPRRESRAERRLQVFGAIGLDFNLDEDNFPVIKKKPAPQPPSNLESETLPNLELDPFESKSDMVQRTPNQPKKEDKPNPEDITTTKPAEKHWFDSPSADSPHKKMIIPVRGVGRSKSAGPSQSRNPADLPFDIGESVNDKSTTQTNAEPEVDVKSELPKEETESEPAEAKKPEPPPVKHWFDSPSAFSPKPKVKVPILLRKKDSEIELESATCDADKDEQNPVSAGDSAPENEKTSELPTEEANPGPEEVEKPEPPPVKHWFDSPSAVSPKPKVKPPILLRRKDSETEEEAATSDADKEEKDPVSGDISEDVSVASETLLDEESSVEITVSDSDPDKESIEEETVEDSDDDMTLETVESENEFVEGESSGDFSYDEESVDDDDEASVQHYEGVLVDDVSEESEYDEVIEGDSMDEYSSYSEESIEDNMEEDSEDDFVEEEVIDDASVSDSNDDASYEEDVLSTEDEIDDDASFDELSVIDEDVEYESGPEVEEVSDDEGSFEEMAIDSGSDDDDDEIFEEILEDSSLDDIIEESSLEDILEESSSDADDIIEEEMLEDIIEESSLEDIMEETSSLEDIALDEYEEFDEDMEKIADTDVMHQPLSSIAEEFNDIEETVIEEEIEGEGESFYSAVEYEDEDGTIIEEIMTVDPAEDGADDITEIIEVYESDYDDMPTELVPISDDDESVEEEILYSETEHDTPFDSKVSFDHSLFPIGEDEELIEEDEEMVIADDEELLFEEESLKDDGDFVGDMNRSMYSSDDSDFRSFDSSYGSNYSDEEEVEPELPVPQVPPTEQLRKWQEDQENLIQELGDGPEMYPRTPKHILNAILLEAESDYQFSKGVQAPDYHMIEFLAVVEEAVEIGKFTKKTEVIVEKVAKEPLPEPPPPPEEPEDGLDKPRKWKFEVPTLPVLNTYQEEEKKKVTKELDKELEEHGYVREEFVVGPEVAAPTPKNVMMAILSAAALDFKLRKVPEQHKKEFESISDAASSIARLTKLKENVIESVSVGEAALKKQDDWAPAGKPIEFERSVDVLLATEAAMMGKMMRRREKEVVSNFDFKARFKVFEDKFDVDEAFDEKGRKIFRTDLLLDQYIKDRREEKADVDYGMSLVEQVQEHEKLKTNISLPTKALPKFGRKAGKQMTQAEWTKILSKAVAERAWDRRYRLHRPKVTLKIKKQCMCPYCTNPNAYQTHEYKRLQESHKPAP